MNTPCDIIYVKCHMCKTISTLIFGNLLVDPSTHVCPSLWCIIVSHLVTCFPVSYTIICLFHLSVLQEMHIALCACCYTNTFMPDTTSDKGNSYNS